MNYVLSYLVTIMNTGNETIDFYSSFFVDNIAHSFNLKGNKCVPNLPFHITFCRKSKMHMTCFNNHKAANKSAKEKKELPSPYPPQAQFPRYLFRKLESTLHGICRIILRFLMQMPRLMS